MIDLGKIPPHDPDAERSVLGAILINNSAIHDIANIMKPEDMYDMSHRTVMSAMTAMTKNGIAIDLITLKGYLQDIHKLDEIGGLMFIVKLADYSFTAANIEYHAKIIRDKAVLRRLILYGMEVSRRCYNGSGPKELTDKAYKDLVNIESTDKGEVKTLDDNEDDIDVVEYVEKMATNPEEYGGIYSGLFDLDDFLGGFHKGWVYIIAGRPSMGKTSLAVTIMCNIGMKKKKNVLLFSLEQPFTDIRFKILSMMTRLNNDIFFKTGTEDVKKLTKIAHAMDNLRDSSIYINDSAMNIDELCSMAVKYKQMKEINMIIIDYLQVCDPEGKYDSLNSAVTSISKRVKKLAKDLDLPILLLSQLSRKLEHRPNKRPILADLRDSGAIEQDADIVIFLYNDKIYNPKKDGFNDADMAGYDVIELDIAKNRNGATGVITLNFYKPYTLFESK